MRTLVVLLRAILAVPLPKQLPLEYDACWDDLPQDSGHCNCTACVGRGGSWRYFTEPQMAPMTGSGGMSFKPPVRYCLQLDSKGQPERPAKMDNASWKMFRNATVQIGEPQQCPDVMCPQFSTCADCTNGTLPCTWRGPAPAFPTAAGTCMFVGDADSFKRLTQWNDIPSMEDKESRRNCSVRGLLALNRTDNLCSSRNDTHDPLSQCASGTPSEHTVCLRGDIFVGRAKAFDCRSECDLYAGECRGVHFLEIVDACMSCLLFEKCLEPSTSEKYGQQYFEVSMGPVPHGDWIFTPGRCPGGCESYRIPGMEVPPMGERDLSPSFYTPWYSDPKRCLRDARCQFCSYPFPAIVSSPLIHRADDPGCFEKGTKPYRAPGLDIEPYCEWNQFLGRTPEAACAQHKTYAACSGSASIGCQWCLSRVPSGRFRQVKDPSDPELVHELQPQCMYYVDALQGCVSLREVHAMSPQSQIPLMQLFQQGKLYDSREQACGAHQMFPNLLTMVSDNSSRDQWYADIFSFDGSSSLDLAFVPMYVPQPERSEQLAKLAACSGHDNNVRKASKQCQEVFQETCSRCVRTPGCWWSDNGLSSPVSGHWSFDNAALPGCFPAVAQQKYVATVSALPSNPDMPIRALTVPEDSEFCFDPCWRFDSCGSCLLENSGRCQWCEYPDASVCMSVSGPYQICLDKYTDPVACPSESSRLETSQTQDAGDEVRRLTELLEAEDDISYWSWLGGLAGLLCLPLLVLVVLRARRCKQRQSSERLIGEVDCGVSGVSMQSMGALDMHHSHVDLCFSGLGFRAKVGHEQKQILRGVSGSVSSGEFLAVMGPSGSGKTTFLDVLAKRKLDEKACDGEVKVNGINVQPHVASYCGGMTEFVPQQDTMLAVHTVTEMLHFVADLKLPAAMPARAKKERVREVISMVGLEHRAAAYIGNNLVRGLSGGERRRAMIAASLVPRAPILFLDEPTSGLSSTDSLRVVEMLAKLAKSHGYAVIAVVHQPQSRLFGHFDKLLLLSEGQVCYMGNAHESVAWFERVASIGMPPAMNPADWLLDVITPGFMESDLLPSCKQRIELERRAAIEQGCNRSISHDASAGLSDTPEFAIGSWKQFRVVAYRCFQAKVREWQVLLTRFGVNFGVAVIAGSALPLDKPLYVHGDTTEPARQINAVLFFVVTFEGLIALTVLPLFAEERELFAHERRARLYRVLPYFFAKISAEAVVQVYSSFIFGAVFYVIVDVSKDLHRLLFYLLTTVLVGDCASAFAQLCSSASRSIVNSLALCAMGLGCFLLFSGFLMLPSSMPPFWTPLYHASFWKYGFQALTINEYAGAEFPCHPLNYSLAARCPPFGVGKDCPISPCMNTTSGHAAAVHVYRRFDDRAEVHNSFLTSNFAAWFLGTLDARQINCRMLCGFEEAPGRYDGDDCVCSSFTGCRNDSKECDPFFWKESRGMCRDTRHLNGLPANVSCVSEVRHVVGEYFLDALGFGRIGSDGKPAPENNPDLAGAQTGYLIEGGAATRVTKYAWLGVLVLISTAFRAANFATLALKLD